MCESVDVYVFESPVFLQFESDKIDCEVALVVGV